MRHLRGLVLPAAIGLIAWSIWVLESARGGVVLADMRVGSTPVTKISDGTDGPPVVVAHGFAGSRQMMQGYGLLLAQAGYTVYAFDFEGHGRHPEPMSGDVSAIEGTTRLLVEQTLSVVSEARKTGTPVALLGHSMATDVLVRVAAETEDIGPLVLLSAFSRAITDAHPDNMLLITGAWEASLARFAGDALRMVDPSAQLGDTAVSGGVVRRAVLAPASEHVAILHSAQGRRAALDWVNAYYGRAASPDIRPTGWALLALLAGVSVLFGAVARYLPARDMPATSLQGRAFWLVVGVPVVVTPLAAYGIDPKLLPVLVADDLMVHCLIYGAVQVGLLVWSGRRLPPVSWLAVAALVAWSILVFGLLLDRYGASFWPIPERLFIIAALCVGTVPFMLADSWTVYRAPAWQRITARIAFFASLGAAVALDFEGLFFLIMIAPVILLFYLTFGWMGRAVSRRVGPGSAGLALGLVLAWSLGVSFPMFSA